MILPRLWKPRLLPQFAAPALPPVIGHRGAAGRAPENTLAGLRRAKELGCAWVEFDARLTADDVLVLCHDSGLQRTTDGRGTIALQPLAVVRRFDAGRRFATEFAGERVPTLDEALLLCGSLGIGANIELKSDRMREQETAAVAAATLRRSEGRLPPLLVSSFQQPVLHAVRRLDRQVPLGALYRVVPRDWAETAAALGCGVLGADHRRLRPPLVAAIRAAGCQLAAYTVNDPARARLLFDWGVTSVFSDVPDIILEAIAGHGPVPGAQGTIG